VVRGKVRIGQGVASSDTCTRVEDEHTLEQLNGLRVGVLELLGQGLTLTLGQGLDESESVLAADGLDNIIRWGSEQLGNNGELVDMVLSGEQRLALEHLGEDTSNTPDIDFNIVLLPSEHDFGGSVVSRRDITGHLGILNTGKTKVANLQVAVLVDQDVAGLQVTVDNTSRVNVFQTTKDLVEEVLNELLLKRS